MIWLHIITTDSIVMHVTNQYVLTRGICTMAVNRIALVIGAAFGLLLTMYLRGIKAENKCIKYS